MRQAPKGLSIAIGGHATLPANAVDKSIPVQEAAMREVFGQVLTVVRAAVQEGFTWNTMTHGSGPQTDLILKRVRECLKIGMHNLPLYYASMDLIASIGMTMERILASMIAREMGCFGADKTGVQTVPTHFLVDPNTMKPVKPIGGTLTEEEIKILEKLGETVKDTKDGKGPRIIVASPKVLGVLPQNLDGIVAVIRAGLLAIAGGTGGVAVTIEEDGEITPHPAVIDKDYAAEAIVRGLAEKEIPTDTFGVIMSDPYTVRNFSIVAEGIDAAGGPMKVTAEERARLMEAAGPIHRIAAADMGAILETPGAVTSGAEPKIRAAWRLVDKKIVRQAIICSPENFGATFIGKAKDAGTVIFKGEKWV